MSDSAMEIHEGITKRWRNLAGQLHRTDGPAIEWWDGDKSWYKNGEWLGYNDEGFWKLWDTLTPEQKKDPVLLTYLPEKF